MRAFTKLTALVGAYWPLLLEQELPQAVRVFVVVVYQTDQPPVLCDALEQLARRRWLGVKPGPFCPDIERLFL